MSNVVRRSLPEDLVSRQMLNCHSLNTSAQIHDDHLTSTMNGHQQKCPLHADTGEIVLLTENHTMKL